MLAKLSPEINKIISRGQHRFMAKSSALTILMIFQEHLFYPMHNRLQTDVVYTNIRKAVD